MSKEQTSITAEEWSINGDGAESTYWLSVFFAGLGKSDKLADVFKIMEQYAQAKVLEALEKHIVGFVIHSANEDLSEDDKGYNEFLNLVKNYIETEVKPKYKL